MQLLTPLLIVEDDVIMQRRLERIMVSIGYETEHLLIRSSIKEVKDSIDYQTLAMAFIDLGLPDGNGLTLISEISQAKPDIPIVVISSWSTESIIIQAIHSGANGYLLKERDDLELTVSIRSILKGGFPIDPSIARYILNQMAPPPKSTEKPSSTPQDADKENVSLTEREHQILNLVSLGLSNQEIADKIFLSRHTIETHIRHIYRKLTVNNRTKAVTKAREIGIL